MGVDDLAVAQDDRDCSGEVSGGHRFIGHVFDQGEAIGVEADGGWIGCGEGAE